MGKISRCGKSAPRYQLLKVIYQCRGFGVRIRGNFVDLHFSLVEMVLFYVQATSYAPHGATVLFSIEQKADMRVLLRPKASVTGLGQD